MARFEGAIQSEADKHPPGDVVTTGTPSGVGVARKPPVYMKNGDTVEIEIDGIGTLKNRVRVIK